MRRVGRHGWLSDESRCGARLEQTNEETIMTPQYVPYLVIRPDFGERDQRLTTVYRNAETKTLTVMFKDYDGAFIEFAGHETNDDDDIKFYSIKPQRHDSFIAVNDWEYLEYTDTHLKRTYRVPLLNVVDVDLTAGKFEDVWRERGAP